MNTVTYSEARQNLAKTMQEVVENHEPVLITRAKNEDCVLISLGALPFFGGNRLFVAFAS